VLIPKGNVPDMKKIPQEITAGMKIIPVDHADQVLRLALELENPDTFLVRKGILDEFVIRPEALALQSENKKTKGESVRH
jgi:predicted ATP-dependent protease